MKFEYDIEGGNFSAAGTASSEIKKALNQLNVDQKVIKRVVVALYETEVNIVAHAYRGKYLWISAHVASKFWQKIPARVYPTSKKPWKKAIPQLPTRYAKWVSVQEWDFPILKEMWMS